MRRSLLCLCVVALSCSSSDPPKAARVPALHRAIASTCTAARGPGVPGGSCSGNDLVAHCHSDGDCTAGANGRCSMLPGGACSQGCTYDECTSDSDCPGAAPCACSRRNSGFPTDPPANKCVSASNCRTDADCGAGGYCSPTTIDDVCHCPRVCHGDAGDYECGDDCGHGYFCHTAKDTCVDDTDCEAGMSCNYDLPSQSWKCGGEMCPS